ncbi:cation transporter [Falsiroseomonas sp. CW058]|uniref:cation transporter n=1 Tax=Falsiroseomonas sp. CW058 TaxID=3388664 RepID=UPI003D311C36
MQHRPAAPVPPARQEAALLSACLLDGAILVAMLAVALWSNSLSLLADLMRGVPMLAVEVVLLLLMRRIHRGRMTEYDYGTSKLEQFANMLAGAVLLLAAVWLLAKLAGRVGVPQAQPAVGLAAAAAIAAVNLALNAALLLALWRAARGGGSLILNGQVVTRLSKTLASGCVTAAIAVNAAFGPEGIGAWADIAGTVVVILVMVAFGARMVQDTLPHLLDRALGEQQQALVNRALAARFDAYDELVAVRTRTEGRHAWIEIELGFAPQRRVAEAADAAEHIAQDLRALVPGARVLVVIRAARAAALPRMAAAD